MNLKLHVVLASIFLMAIIGAASLNGAFDSLAAKQEKQTLAMMSEEFIQIFHATWGMNCNAYIQKKRSGATWNELQKAPKEVAYDNALKATSKLCNGRDSCEFKVNPTFLGDDPVKGCRKNLEVRYRCTTTGRMLRTEAENNSTITINCGTASMEAKADGLEGALALGLPE